MTFKILYLLIVGVLLINCNPKSGKKTSGEIAHTSTIVKTRFFSDSSFWNKPLPEQVEIDTKSDHFIGLMKKDPVGAFFKINLEAWTIPVYEVNDSTPRYKIGLHYLSEEEKLHWNTQKETYGHGVEFDAEPVPIPDGAKAESKSWKSESEYGKSVQCSIPVIRRSREAVEWRTATMPQAPCSMPHAPCPLL